MQTTQFYDKGAVDALLPYKSASSVADRKVAYYDASDYATAGTLAITLPEISSATAAGTAVQSVDIVIDATDISSSSGMPTVTINGATPTGASSPQAVYAVDGEMPTFEANALNLVSCVSVPALTAWVILAATNLTAVTQSSSSAS